jgi:acyl-CoA hydrolase
MQPQKAEVIKSWELVFPNDTNPRGTMFGGKLMSMMDKIAAIAAGRYSGKSVVTASTEAIVFKKPIKQGDRIQIIGQVAWVGRTSIVVKVDVYAENPATGSHHHCTTAHFNFVALDSRDNPASVPPLLVETEEEKRNYAVAEFVKKQALERRKKIQETD